MLVRYDLQPDPDGWTIVDRTTNAVALIADFVPVGLPYDEADDFVDLLNTLDVLRREGTQH